MEGAGWRVGGGHWGGSSVPARALCCQPSQLSALKPPRSWSGEDGVSLGRAGEGGAGVVSRPECRCAHGSPGCDLPQRQELLERRLWRGWQGVNIHLRACGCSPWGWASAGASLVLGWAAPALEVLLEPRCWAWLRCPHGAGTPETRAEGRSLGCQSCARGRAAMVAARRSVANSGGGGSGAGGQRSAQLSSSPSLVTLGERGSPHARSAWPQHPRVPAGATGLGGCCGIHG